MAKAVPYRLGLYPGDGVVGMIVVVCTCHVQGNGFHPMVAHVSVCLLTLNFSSVFPSIVLREKVVVESVTCG